MFDPNLRPEVHPRLRPKTRLPSMAAFLVAGPLALPLSATAADLPPAEKILARYAEAIGGEAVSRVESRAAEFEFSMPNQGVYATGVEYRKAPGDYYFRIDLASSGVQDFESGVSGDVAWQVHPMTGTTALKGDERKTSLRTARIDRFAGWEDFFDSARTTGEEVVGDKACYKVEFASEDGPSVEGYFEKDTGLLVREVSTGSGGAVVTTDFVDWEETQGIRSPRSIRQKGLQSFNLRFTSVTYDGVIPEGTFEVPSDLR